MTNVTCKQCGYPHVKSTYQCYPCNTPVGFTQWTTVPTPKGPDGQPARQPCPNCCISRLAIQCTCQRFGCGHTWTPTYTVGL